jgi:alpha-N-arabinofuranosidase
MGAQWAVGLVLGAGLVVASAGGPGEAARHGDDHIAASTTVTIDAGTRVGAVRPGLLGVNHHYRRNGFGVWDGARDRPVPAVVEHLRKARVASIRYPGGIVANLFNWRSAVGDRRVCQVDGNKDARGGYPSLRAGLDYGVDEHMRLVRDVGAGAVMMVQTITETARGAADWVEYMNATAGTTANPNGGVDWAEVRASNGHPRPYDVRHWELGNEQRLLGQRYWMSGDDTEAVRQYAFGGARQITNEPLGKRCSHRIRGTRSNGTPNQVFELLYPPAALNSITVTVGGAVWRRIDDLASAGPRARVFVARPVTGKIRFGDGAHGAIPAAGTAVRASYRSVHQGAFRFARAMKAVDPTIDVCLSWGTELFLDVIQRRDFDCFTAHRFLNFERLGLDDWDTTLEGHDLHMLHLDSERETIASLKARLPPGMPLPLTEFGPLFGDTKTYPSWAASMTHATFMASEWLMWLRLGIPWGNGNDLLTNNNHGLVGPAPGYTFTAEAATRQTLTPMFRGRGSQLRVRVSGNPRRDPQLGLGTYPGLAVAATMGTAGRLHVAVVNRLPRESERIEADIRLDDFTSGGSAVVRRVVGESFVDWNQPGEPLSVQMTKRTRAIGSGGFTAVFPAHSVTLYSIAPG